MTDPQEKEDNKLSDLKKFVEKIASFFEITQVSQLEMIKNSGKKPQVSAYILREIASRGSKPCDSTLKKKHSFIRVVPDYEFKETIQKTLTSSAQGAHRLTLKQNLHFDAFKQLLLEKGLAVKKVVDWRIHNPAKATLTIRQWGKTYSSVKRNPSFIKRICVIYRK
jgi:hypothetical protein